VPGLAVAQRGAVLTLRLERPEQRNAIDDVMMAGLIEAVDLAGRDESVRAISLTGPASTSAAEPTSSLVTQTPVAGPGSGRSNGGFPRWPIGSFLSCAKSRYPSSVR